MDCLLIGLSNGEILVWDIDSKLTLKKFVGHTESINCLLFYKNKVLSASNDKTIKFWDFESGICTHISNDHNKSVNCLAIINDDYLASGSGDSTIKLMSFPNLMCVQTFRGHTSSVTTLSSLKNKSNDLLQIISGSKDSSIKIWNLIGECIRTLFGHYNTILSIIQISDTTIICSDESGTIKFWDLDSFRNYKSFNCSKDSPVIIRQFTNETFLSCSFDNTIKIWNIKSGSFTSLLYCPLVIDSFELI